MSSLTRTLLRPLATSSSSIRPASVHVSSFSTSSTGQALKESDTSTSNPFKNYAYILTRNEKTETKNT